METNAISLNSIKSRAKTVIATSHMTARRVGAWATLAILGATASGALLAQAPQAVGTWLAIGPVSTALANGAVVALPDNQTLIIGGTLADGALSDAATIYDPVTNSVIAAGTLASARTGHTATLLRDGRVLVVGGMTPDGLVSPDIEVFDRSTGTSTVVALLPEPRRGHVAAELLDGTVLVAGGASVDGAVLQTAVLLNPATGSVATLPGQLHVARVHASATTLLDGRVLVAGGSDGTADLASGEIYDPYSRSFLVVATQMSVGRQGHSAVLLPHNGGVLVAGGTSDGVAQAGADVFLPAVFPDPFSYGEGEFMATGAMTAARATAVAGPTNVEGYAFAATAGSVDREVYRFPTIKTDKDDYAPGELAVITGSGWQPNEEVRLLFQEDPAVHDDYVLNVTADGNGNILWNEWAPDQHDFGVRFYLTASDSKARAQTTFTDGNKVTFSTTANGTPVEDFGTVSPDQCVNAFVQERQGNSVDANHPARPVALTSAPTGASFFVGANCATAGSTVTIPANGTSAAFSFRIAAGSSTAYIINGNGGFPVNSGNNASASVTLLADTTRPTVAMSSATGDPTNAATIAVLVTFSESVSGFTAGDLTIVNGAADSFSGNGASYSFTLTPSGDGLVTVDIAPNVAQDAAGNGNEAAAQFSRTSDRTAPTILATRETAANADGWNNTDVTASYTASDEGSGLATGSPATGTFTFTAEGAGQSHTFTVTDNAGNIASAVVGNVNIDKTAPTVTATPAPAANASGWNNTNVTVTFAGTDALSEIADCQAPSVLSAEGSGQSASGSCTDKAGNTAQATASEINIDKTAPTISASRLPVANASGWNNTDVTASYTASDEGSGLATGSPATGTFTFTTEGAGQSHTFTVTDNAGNTAQATIGDVNIDRTAPTVTATPAPAANASGWNNTNVTVTFAGTDALSEIADCQAPSVLSAEGSGQSASGSCTDKAGNTAQAAASGINIDKTAPTISANRLPLANAFGWNNTPVTASYTAADALSGLSSLGTGSYVFSAEGAGLTHTFTVIDRAGNTASAAIGNVNIDVTAPTLTVVVAPNPVVLNGAATVTVTAIDALSGVQTQSCPSVSTSSVGANTLECSATDKAGNTGTGSAQYVVIYGWNGFLQPINDTAHQITLTQSKFKLGQTVPVKFVLRDAAGIPVQQTTNPGFLMSGYLGECQSFATPEEVQILTPNVVPVFTWDGAQYHFNWSTKGLVSGVYRISAQLADGTQPWVDICLRK